jgi:hypothetical protein
MRPLPTLLLALLLLAAAHAAASPAASPGRLDLGTLAAGTSLERTIAVSNAGGEAVLVAAEVEALDGEIVTVSPSRFRLHPGASRAVDVTLTLPTPASGGRHDVRVTFVETPADAPRADVVGRAATRVPIVFHVDGLKIGGAALRDAGVEVLVQNFLPSPAAPHVTVVITDSGGAEVARSTVQAPAVGLAATAAVLVPLPLADLAPGAYGIRATAAEGGVRSNEASLALERAPVPVAAPEPVATPAPAAAEAPAPPPPDDPDAPARDRGGFLAAILALLARLRAIL